MPDIASEKFTALFGPEFGHGKQFDLKALHAALAALENPHRKLAPIVHVAGTNGKGSTIAFMRAVAEAAGLRVHAFTKPHLFALSERFTIASTGVDDDALLAAAARVAAIATDLTQFDAQVAAAFLLFSETPADLVLLETGMGGRDDSTNVVAPALSVITPIGLDHQDALGRTLGDIAAHKAGIIKPNTPAIIARQNDAARHILEAHADALGAPVYRHGVEWDAYPSHGRLVVQTQTRALDLSFPVLEGPHQIDNAGLACAALMLLRPDFTDAAFDQGIAAARWPARLQPLTKGALSAAIRARGGEVWVDAGHNADAAAALVRALSQMQRRRPAPCIVIAGLRARKDASAFADTLGRFAESFIALPLSEDHVAPQALAQMARASGANACTAASLQEAMQIAAQSPAPRVLICGSFLLAAAALAAENA